MIKKYPHTFEDEFKFIDNLKYVGQAGNGDFRSEDTYLLKHPSLSKIKEFIYESLNEYTERILMTDQRLLVTQCWVNKNPFDSSHHEHIHPNSIISGVFCLRQNNTMPPIVFHKYGTEMFLNPKKYNDLNSKIILFPMVDGEFVLFPSHLRHSVPINRSKDIRYSLSFNTFSVDELGDKDSLTHLNIKELVGDKLCL